MPDNATGAMAQFGRAGSSVEDAGLLLLFAEGFRALPSVWRLGQGRHVVGRESPADVVVPVHAVSRQHAEIAWDRGGYVVRDTESTNGTFVDGRRVSECRLEHGQEVRFGDAVFKFVERDAVAYSGYRIDGTLAPSASRLASSSTNLVGGYQMDRITAEVERIAATELSILLLGESGTGKEVVAREVHERSGRKGAFRAVNCAAIPENLIESELFGYKRGAFSGADRDKPGLIRSAHEGTLLLDEIGDMPLDAQAKLLRVVQSKELYPVGSTTPELVDVRIVSATHRDLTRLQREDRFRPDLFARLNEYQLSLPPLRDRKEDVYLLFRTFLARHGRPELGVSFLFMTSLLHYDWPYNVRELEACAKRALALSESPVLDVPLLPESIREQMEDYGRAQGSQSDPGPQAREGLARSGPPTEAELRDLLQSHQGNVAAVGRVLGKARMQIHRWVDRYQIDLEDYRSNVAAGTAPEIS